MMGTSKKPTAADRPEFRRRMAGIVERLGIESAEIDQDTMLVCSRAADFNPDDNVLWELEANRSQVRPDVHCFHCGSTLAMSNGAYRRYLEQDRKPKVVCLHCLQDGGGR